VKKRSLEEYQTLLNEALDEERRDKRRRGNLDDE
jgi:hypothetical protein